MDHRTKPLETSPRTKDLGLTRGFKTFFDPQDTLHHDLKQLTSQGDKPI